MGIREKKIGKKVENIKKIPKLGISLKKKVKWISNGIFFHHPSFGVALATHLVKCSNDIH